MLSLTLPGRLTIILYLQISPQMAMTYVVKVSSQMESVLLAEALENTSRHGMQNDLHTSA